MEYNVKSFNVATNKIMFVFFAILIFIGTAVGSFFIGNMTASQTEINHISLVEEVSQLPVFEIASAHIFGTSHGRFEVTETPLLGFIPRGQTTLVYQYSWSFLLGTSEPVMPRLVGEVLTLLKSDLEIEIIGEVAVFDFYEIDTSTNSWLANRRIPTEYVFYLMDRARLTTEESLETMEIQIEFARQNMMSQLRKMYEALGFRVEWI